MPIQVKCSCGRAFTVADGQAGAKAFCPVCGVQSLVPASESGGAARIAILAGGVLVVAGVAYGAYWFHGRKGESTSGTGGQGGSSLHSVEDPNARGPGHAGGTTSPNPSHPTPDHPTPDHPTPTGLAPDVAQHAAELIGQLDSTDEYVSTRAARELAEIGPDVAPLVEQAATQGKKKARLVLRAIRWKTSLPAALQTKYDRLLVTLNSEGDTARAQVIKQWLASGDRECAPLLSDLVDDEAAEVRTTAILAAIAFHATVSSEGVSKLLHDSDSARQLLGVLAAGLLGVSGVSDDIRPLLAVPDRRIYAMITLGLLRDEESSAEIAKSLTDPAPLVRARAYEALGRIGRFPGGFPIDVIRDSDPSVKEAWVVAAGRSGEETLVPQFSQFLADKSSPRMRCAAVEAIAALGQGNAGEVLLPLLGDPDANVRYETARALGRLRFRRAVSGIAVLLDDRAPANRTSDDAPLRAILETVEAAASGLGRDLPAPPAREVREGAVLALEQASGQRFDGATLDERVTKARAWCEYQR